MKFSKNYSKLNYPIFTTIRRNIGYYWAGQIISVQTPSSKFLAEIVSIRNIKLTDITDTMALRDADCTKLELIKLMYKFYKDKSNDLILLTIMKIGNIND